MKVDTIARYYDRAADICSHSRDVQDFLFTYLESSTFTRGDPFSLSLSVYPGSLETTS